MLCQVVFREVDIAGVIRLHPAVPLVNGLHGEHLAGNTVDLRIVQAVDLVLEHTDVELPRLAVVAGLVGHLDDDRTVVALVQVLEVRFDAVAVELPLGGFVFPGFRVQAAHLREQFLLAVPGGQDDLFQDLAGGELIQVDQRLHDPFQLGVALLDDFLVGGVAVNRFILDDAELAGLRIDHDKVKLQWQVNVGDVITHAAGHEDTRILGQFDDIQLHGAAGAETPGADHVDLIREWLAGQAEVALPVAAPDDRGFPLVKQFGRSFAGPYPRRLRVVRRTGLLLQHGSVDDWKQSQRFSSLQYTLTVS